MKTMTMSIWKHIAKTKWYITRPEMCFIQNHTFNLEKHTQIYSFKITWTITRKCEESTKQMCKGFVRAGS